VNAARSDPPARRTQAIARRLLWAMMAATGARCVGHLGFVLSRGVPHVTWTFLPARRATAAGGRRFPMIVAPRGHRARRRRRTPLARRIYLTEYTRESVLTRATARRDSLAAFRRSSSAYSVRVLRDYARLGWSIVAAA